MTDPEETEQDRAERIQANDADRWHDQAVDREADAYPEGWPEFARKLKDEQGWKCERCNHVHDVGSGHVLTVHHLTGNKSQPFTDRWAFAVLCQRCHLTIQSRVKMDQMFFTEILDVSEWFKPHLEGYLRSKSNAPAA